MQASLQELNHAALLERLSQNLDRPQRGEIYREILRRLESVPLGPTKGRHKHRECKKGDEDDD
jgi:hypothetical protein